MNEVMTWLQSFYLHPLVLSLIIGGLVFIISYIHFPSLLQFFTQKTMSSQKKVLQIMDWMMLKTPKKKVALWLWLIGLGVGFAIFLLCWPHLILGLILGAIFFLLTLAGIQRTLVIMWDRRADQLVADMVEGLVIMTNSLKVGLSVTQAMERVTKSMGGPFSQELKLVLNKVRLGMSVEEALEEMEKRINRSDLTMMVVAVNILKETGGNMAETFSVIAETIRERQKLENKIKALTAQGNMQATIISFVPFGIMLMMFTMDKAYAEVMLQTPLGWVSMVLILSLIIFGGYMMRKIVAIKV